MRGPGAGRPAGVRGRPLPWRVLAAVGVATAVVLVVWVLPAVLTRSPRVTGAERHKAMADVRTSLIALLGALGAAGGLSFTARTYRLSQLAQLTGRFQDASKQMGDHHSTVRLGGIQAMAQLADEWVAQRQRCVDVLCAFVRAPEPDGDGESGYRDDRRRVIELIAERIRPGGPMWTGCNFDLTGAVLKVGDFSDVSLATGRFSFEHARFAGRVRFDGARFTGAHVSFADAQFERGCEVTFDGAAFDGGAVVLDRADFTGGRVRFAARFLPGCTVTFADARLGNGGSVSFSGADFASSSVSFADARFVEAKDGGGDVSFVGASIQAGSRLDFDGATFARTVRFDGAQLTGATLSFRSAKLVRDRVVFDGSACDGAVMVVDGAESQGGCLDVGGADGKPHVVGGDLGPPLFCDH